MFRINHEENGKKHGECSLFSSLAFAQPDPIFYESQVSDTASLEICDVKTEPSQNTINASTVVVCFIMAKHSIFYNI